MHARIHVAYALTRGSGCATEAATASGTPSDTHRKQGLKRHVAVRATKGPPLTASSPFFVFPSLPRATHRNGGNTHASHVGRGGDGVATALMMLDGICFSNAAVR